MCAGNTESCDKEEEEGYGSIAAPPPKRSLPKRKAKLQRGRKGTAKKGGKRVTTADRQATPIPNKDEKKGKLHKQSHIFE